MGKTIRRRLLGLLLLVVIAAFVTVTVAQFEKAFTPVVMVSLHTDHAGSQLLPQSDVKIHGVVVGEVRTIDATAEGADLRLAIQPDQAKLIPGDVVARLLPKTLFGERYVALDMPESSANSPYRSGRTLTSGDRIEQDHSAQAVETEAALNDLMPVLQAVQPQKLSSTLTALSQALSGRGAQLGDTIKTLGRYIGDLNPQLPTIEHDLSALADVSGTYSQATPHLVQALNDLTTTAQTLADQRANLSNLYATVSDTAQNLQNFLQINESNLIAVVTSSRPTLDVLARYAPEYPCVFHGLAGSVDKVDRAFGKGTDEPGLHATVEITVNRGPYLPGQDTPRYADHRGPRCYNLDAGSRFPQYPPDGPINDGATHPPAPPVRASGLTVQTFPSAAAPQVMGLPNSPVEQSLIAALAGPEAGVDPARIPGWSSLLLGPLFRGSEVELK